MSEAALTSLYVRRPVIDDCGLIEWAHSCGLRDTLSLDHLHVTVIYSRFPVDPLCVRPLMNKICVEASGQPMIIKSALTMPLMRGALAEDHARYLCAGASHDYTKVFEPHVTLKYDPSPEDLDLLLSGPLFAGMICLGPEVHEPLRQGWRPAS